ncbi:MAG: hypothetical protein ACE5ID_05070 [Acidobacteriota bacterium]
MKTTSGVPGWSKGRKLALGCLIAAGTAVLGLILTVILSVRWLHSPSETMEAHRLLGAETTLFLEMTLDGKNATTRDFVRRLVGPLQRPRMDSDALPEPFSRLLPHLPRRRVTTRDIDRLLPITVIVTIPRPASGDGNFLVTLNYPRAGHTLKVFDLFLGFMASGDDKLQVREIRGEQVLEFYEKETHFWICIVDTDLLLASSEAALEAGIELLTGGPEERQASPPLARALVDLPRDAALKMAAVEGQAALLVGLLEPGLPGLAEVLRPVLLQTEEIRLWARLKEPDTLEGEVRSETWETAPQSQEAPARTLAWRQADLGITLEWVPAGPSSSSPHWRFEVDGVLSLLKEWPSWNRYFSSPENR